VAFSYSYSSVVVNVVSQVIFEAYVTVRATAFGW